MDFEQSQTKKNLEAAFAGESQAHTKYRYYSSKAKKEGFVQISNIFMETALNEAEHAKLWFKELHGGDIPSTLENLRDAAAGRCIALCASLAGAPVGYINLYFKAFPPYAKTDWPEIVDFGVLEKHRRSGIGTALMDAAEALAAARSDTVCIGVGLHSGYGSAQRMYVKRGYIPDGAGVWYRGEALAPYAACVNDDDLNLYFTKKLR